MKTTNVHTLAKWFADSESFVLIDCREPHEREISVFPNDRWIRMGEIMQRLNEIPKNLPVVIYCRTGARSGSVVEYLNANGYDNVSNLAGGINAYATEIDPSYKTY